MSRITITKVVSKNFFFDFIAGINNFLGQNVTSYEKMMQKGINQIEEEIKEKDINLKWYRYQISELRDGSMVIMLYGEQ